MTLPEICDCSESQEANTMIPDSPNANKTCQALKSLLKQATTQGRVTCSLTSCVELLSTRPDDVMLCVMPQLTNPDAAASIQSTLIRAVCQEHCIRVLSVDCDIKLAKAVCADLHEKAEEEEEEGARKGVDHHKLDNNCNNLLSSVSDIGSDDTFLISGGCDNMAPVMGFPCVLVQYPQDGASTDDEMVAEFCKAELYGSTMTEPYLELPD